MDQPINQMITIKTEGFETEKNTINMSTGDPEGIEYAVFKKEVLDTDCDFHYGDMPGRNNCEGEIVVDSYDVKMPKTEENSISTSMRNYRNSERDAVTFKEEIINESHDQRSEYPIKTEEYNNLHTAIDIKDEVFNDSVIMNNSDSESCTKIHLKEEFHENDLKTWNSSIDIDLEKSSNSNDHTRKIHCDEGSALKNKLLSYAAEKSFHCEYCERRFAVKRYLRTHLLTHTGKKTFKCDICEKSFMKRDYLRTHLRTHTGEKPFNCDYCGNKFDRKTNLQRHLLTHTGEKPFNCDHCGKKFALKTTLQRHILTHTGKKPFKCDHCDKSFNQDNNLRSHALIHTGEKPFKCDHCDKSFTQKANLQNHLFTHSGEKPFTCDHCGKKFSLTTTLQRHILTHTGEKPFKCDHCNKRFLQKANLQRHLSTHTRT